MKKRIVVCCLGVACSMLFFAKVNAKSFTEEVRANSTFSIYIPLSKITLVKNFTKITDEYGNPLYEVSPKMSYSVGRSDYVERDAYFRKDILKKFSQTLYFGYGYKDRKSEEAYFATQYLLYQILDDIEASYQVDGVESNILQEEMVAIQKDIESISFSLNNFTTTKDTYEIDTPYLVENFQIKGENIDVSYENDKIIVTFLNQKNHYDLTFVPKNDCNHMQVWNSISTELMARMPICEEEHRVSVTYKREEKPSQDTETVENIANKTETEDNDERKNSESSQNDGDFQEVYVPDTYQSNCSFLLLVGLLGVTYFVFKK